MLTLVDEAQLHQVSQPRQLVPQGHPLQQLPDVVQEEVGDQQLSLELHVGAVAMDRGEEYLIGGLAVAMKCLEELAMVEKEGVLSALLMNLVAHIPTINIITHITNTLFNKAP